MIVIKLKGGLGNQMFQYALYKYFLNKYPNDHIRLDVSYFSQKHDLGEGVATRQCDILNFDVKISNPLISIPPVLNKIFGKTNFYHKETSDITFKPQILEKRHGIFDGYWQSEKYFEGIKDIIFKELVLKDNLDSYNQKTLDSIIETASVSIHVRRGDYLNLGLELTNWNKYYSDALTYINCRHKIEKVFVFSDDVLWVKENIKTTFPIEYVSHHEKHQDNKDLILMSKCKYNIIANSTFSWWAAYLNQHKDKIVIAPKIWSTKIVQNIIPKNWIQM
ncbi:MAG: hypothetical protein ACI9UJ_000966 [bacterium]|jgi:hypothetical protein